MTLLYCATCQMVLGPYQGSYCPACGCALYEQPVPKKGDQIVVTEDGKILPRYSGWVDIGSDIPGGGAT